MFSRCFLMPMAMHMITTMDMTMDMDMATQTLHSNGQRLPMKFPRKIRLLMRRELTMKQLWAMDMLMLWNMRKRRKTTIMDMPMQDMTTMAMLMKAMVMHTQAMAILMVHLKESQVPRRGR